jgi:hypothetical protein
VSVVLSTERGKRSRPSIVELFSQPPPRPRRIALVVLTLAIGAAYLFFATAGLFGSPVFWPSYNADFNELAEGFRSGHLYVPAAPAPELLAQADPYDWGTSGQWWYSDLSLYKGHYYMYWGPVSALVIALVKIVFRIKTSVGDQLPQIIFYWIYLVCGVVLIDRLARRLFPRLSFLWVVVAILVYAFANPTPYLVATPSVYLAAIAGGQAFLVAGLVCALAAFGPSLVTGWLRAGPALGAGACWALAIGCRASMGPPVLLLALLTAYMASRPAARRWVVALRNLAWLATPVALASFALLLYNRLRFDSWLEFGLKYQLNTLHFRASRYFVGPNLYSYLLRPMGRSCHFPFLTAVWDIGARGFPASFRWPAGYVISEPVVGFLNGTPWSWLALVALASCAWTALRTLLRPAREIGSARAARAWVWCVASAAIMGSVSAAPTVAIFTTTIRYTADVSTGLILCAILGSWWLVTRCRDRGAALRRTVAAALVGLAAVTVVMGLLLGVSGYNQHLKHYNPQLFNELKARLSICAD